jgi:hypothetical protein
MDLHVGDRVYVLKYGDLYPATITHVTPTRVKVAFTTKGGKPKELFVPRNDIVGRAR